MRKFWFPGELSFPQSIHHAAGLHSSRVWPLISGEGGHLCSLRDVILVSRRHAGVERPRARNSTGGGRGHLQQQEAGCVPTSPGPPHVSLAAEES